MTSTDSLPLELPDSVSSRSRWGQLYGSAQSLAVAQAARRYRGTLCAITSSATAADALERELAFFFSDSHVRRFSDYETLPYDAFSPPQELIAERLSTLASLTTADRAILIVNAQALLTRLPPRQFVVARSLALRTGETIERELLRDKLISNGYLHVEKVLGPGEFAVRGSLLDIFPTGAATPIRIDLFDDEIETLRTFDPETQRSTGAVDQIRILPAKEFPFDRESIRGFRENFRVNVAGEPTRSSIYRDIS
ncbi:MAG TPA: transcription-repair coupling factor, partial [Gammaproteobacteria bacterium]